MSGDRLFKFLSGLSRREGLGRQAHLNCRRKRCRSSRMVACLLVLAAMIAACSVAIQPVASQVCDPSTSTQTNAATYFTVSVVTSNVVVTFLTVQYTTNTSLFTIMTIQFTTATSNITRTPVLPEGAPSLDVASSVRALNPQPDAQSRTPVDLRTSTSQVAAVATLELVASSLLLLISICLVLKKRR